MKRIRKRGLACKTLNNCQNVCFFGRLFVGVVAKADMVGKKRKKIEASQLAVCANLYSLVFITHWMKIFASFITAVQSLTTNPCLLPFRLLLTTKSVDLVRHKT